MPSKIQVDQIAGATGSTVTLPSGQTLDLSSGTVNLPSSALSALNASNLTSGTVPSARLSLSSSDLPTVPTTKGGTGLTTIGTANQVLRVNSGATALEFATASSDVVKLASGSVGTSTSFSIDGYYSATYNYYKLIVQNVVFSTGNWLVGRINFSGSPYTSANYQVAVGYGTSSNSGGGAGSNTETKMWFGYWDTGTSGYGNSTEIRIFNPQSTSHYKSIGWSTSERDGTNAFAHTGTSFLNANQSTASSGITLLGHNGGSFSTGIWTLYGFK